MGRDKFYFPFAGWNVGSDEADKSACFGANTFLLGVVKDSD